MTAREALQRIWWRRDEPAWAEAALWPLSLLALGYGAGAAIARRAARPERAGAPVISVGNLSVGGAGKTPVALAIAERLLARGLRPAVLSRGYGGSADVESTTVSDGAGPLVTADVAGDEPVLLARRVRGLRVLVGPRRAALAREAVQRGSDVLLLDDGLQHHALARDLDVLVVDAANPLGNGRLLPRGPLREGPAALDRLAGRGLLWLTRAELRRDGDAQLAKLIEDARRITGRAPVESAFEPAPDAPQLAGKSVFLFAGVARPASFEALVKRLGADVRGTRWFPDHHRFAPGELDGLARAAGAAGATALVTTEKDAVRLADLSAGSLPIVPLPVSLKILRGEDALESALDAALRRSA